MTLKIVEGGYYQTRGGAIAGPMKPSATPAYPWKWTGVESDRAFTRIFDKSGENYDGPASPHTLVREWFGPGVISDPVNRPAHYTGHPSGVECITITEHMNFCRGNAVKYIWRAGEKGDEVEDLKKARWYIDREISRLSKTALDGLSKVYDKT